QACQVHAGANAALSPGAILVSHMTLQLVDEPREILFNAYANEANLFTSPLPGFPRLVTSGTPSKPHAMVVSSTRVYFFWVAADKICARTFDGTDFTAVATFTNADTNATYGVSGCLVNAAGSEFIALTYATSNSAINIVSFKDSDFTNNGDFSITATTSLPIGIFDSTHVGITQNPRTGKMLLLWENAGVAKFRTGDFSAPGGTFSFSGETTFGAGFEKTFGVALSGFENFENSFVLPHDLDGQEKHYLLKEPAAVSLHSMLPDIPDIGYAVLFPYTASGKKYAGLINLSSYYKFDFYRRPLEYPRTCSWQNPDKTLHIQGPPMSGTTVRAEVYFAEVLPASSLANLVNTGGNRVPFNGQTGVIASSTGNIYSIKFDKDMKQADFEGLINNAVKMLDDGDITVPLTYVGSSSREIFFRSSSDLAFNKTYRILVASSVIDANGSQIYEDATLSFTTQNSYSNVLASEVIKVEVFSDNTHAPEKLIASGSEVNATSTLYLRMNARDPAFNTIDRSSVTVFRNGTQIAVVPVAQAAASSDYFYGSYDVRAPLAEDSVYEFKTPAVAISTQVRVDFPALLAGSPASGAINVPANSVITITADEDLASASVDTGNIKLFLDGSEVGVGVSYSALTDAITVVPAALLQSQQVYTVVAKNLKDLAENPQLEPLIYTFTIADITPPSINSTYPLNNAEGVTIDKIITVDFSENILPASVDKTSVKLSRGGVVASFSLSLSGSRLLIDPDDAPDGGLRPSTEYLLELKSSITDLPGNNLSILTDPHTLRFTTQPYVTAPAAIDSLTLYKDQTLSNSWVASEKVPASSAIYLKITGSDGATQTRDVATVTLNL
ncbi:MAG: Ig-like domain-containing protein, partial [Candidatus Riflebacteria bacterium]|nr:Ig-like domain-containing protein [Candidatus Riflebacteria bacterium]